MEQYTIGVDVGGTKIAYGLFDGEQNLGGSEKVPSDPELKRGRFLMHWQRTFGLLYRNTI